MNRSTITTIRPDFFALLLLLLIPSAPLGAVEIAAQLSRNPVAMNESFDLHYSASEEPDGAPDWTPLTRHFELLNQGRSQTTKIINGDTEHTIRWSLTLLPKAVGEWVIPPLSFGADRSQPVSVKVVQGAQAAALPGDDLFLKVELSQAQVYLQQQVILSVRLYRAVNMGDASLTAPEHEDLIIEKLGDDQQFEKRVNGKVYAVTERRYLLFPQRSGTFQIPPIRFQGEIFEPAPGRGGFFGFPFSGRGQRTIKHLASEPLELEVLPIPHRATGGPWLPATHLQLAEAWPNDTLPEFQVGEPVTRTLLLLADGLTSAQLPALHYTLPEGLKQYPDQPLLKDRQSSAGVTGIREEKVALVPTRAGQFTLPAIEVRWWNLERGALETARIPAQTITVHPKTGKEAITSGQGESAASAPETAPEHSPPPGDPLPTAEREVIRDPGYWPWVSLVLGIGWLATLLGGWWFGYRQGGARRLGSPTAAPAVKPDAKAIRNACQADDAAQCAEALLRWATDQWPEDPPRSLGGLASRVSEPVGEEIGRLERALYSPQPSEWRGAPLWEAWKTAPPHRTEPGDRDTGIAPLYPESG